MSKTTNFTLEESISLLALFQSGSDGNIDESEIKVITENDFFKQYNIIDNKQLLLDLLDTGNLVDILKDEVSKTFKDTELQFKEDFINALLQIILADGSIEDEEINVLNFTANVIGLSTDDVNRLMREETKRIEASNEKLKSEIEAKKREIANGSSGNDGGCFIATATMGDYNHPIVMDFRDFRDETLSQSILGKLFIKIYYTLGPYPASLIAKSNKLKELTLKYLIKPMHKRIIKNL